MTGSTGGGRNSALLPILDSDLVYRLASMPDAIEASRLGFIVASQGEVSTPLRSSMSRGRILVMPAEHVSGSGVIKVISNSASGPRDRPSIEGLVLWIEGTSGAIVAVLDAGSLTAIRTGSASGLATSVLAPVDSAVLAMLGSGGQAFQQIAAVCAVRGIKEVRVQSRSIDRSRALCRRLEADGPGVEYRAVATAREALVGADVVCTATRAMEALFDVGDLKPDVHINAVGAYRPDMREIPNEVFRRASVVVIDQVEAALAEAGDLIAAIRAGAVAVGSLIELGTLLAVPQGERTGITVFKSVGIAAQDWSIAELVVRRAREAGLIRP